MCRIDGSERDDLTVITWRQARKPHVCVECGRKIEPGERYRRDAGLYDGKWSVSLMCRHCAVGAEWLGANCGGWISKQVAEELIEHARDYPAIATPLRRVAVGMRRKWATVSGGDLMPEPTLPPSIPV